jgi:hypothetical protein
MTFVQIYIQILSKVLAVKGGHLVVMGQGTGVAGIGGRLSEGTSLASGSPVLEATSRRASGWRGHWPGRRSVEETNAGGPPTERCGRAATGVWAAEAACRRAPAATGGRQWMAACEHGGRQLAGVMWAVV